MKYNHRNRFRLLASSSAIALSLCASASAAVIAVPAAGGLALTTANNGANTVTGGAVALSTITAPAGVVLTGDAAKTQVVEITAGTYTLTNAGVLAGTNHRGLTTTTAITVTNTGTISGAGVAGPDGIQLTNATGTSTITNSTPGVISGPVTGITSAAGPTTIVNSGTITGGTSGIAGGAGVTTITNSGTISGGTSAMVLGAVNDIVTLNDGSVITGAMDFGLGTDALTLNGGRSSLADTTGNVINGAISNLETLTKAGTDTAFITGAVNANTIAVTGGALYINGAMTSIAPVIETAVTVTNAGLGGTGTWNAAITLTGTSTISPGAAPLALASPLSNSVGTLAVDGSISLDATSAYRWNINPATNAGDLIQTTFHLGDKFTVANSGFVIVPTSLTTPILDGSRIVVDTADTLVGNFGAITVDSTTNPILASFSSLTKVNGGQDWQLTIVHNYGAYGANPNQVAAGNILSAMVPTATGATAAMLANLDYSDAQATRNTLASLDPGTYFGGTQALANSNFRLHRILEQQEYVARRTGGSTVSSTPSAAPSSSGTAPAGSRAFSTGSWNVWGSFDYSWQNMSAGNGLYDFDGETAAVTAGLDFSVANALRIGAVIDGSWATWDSSSNNSQDTDSMRIGAYVNWGEATGWFAQAFGGYHTGSISQSRPVSIGGIANLARADYDADGWQGMAAVGYTADSEFGTFMPYAGIESQSLNADNFTESGSFMPLSVSGLDVTSTRALIGLGWETGVGSGSLYAGVTYAHELENDAPTATVGFGGGSYTAAGITPNDALLLSAGVRWMLSEATTLNAGYMGEISLDDDGLDSNGLNLGVNYAF